ncbi:MAG: single-stranded-DNA-specific exonuclease RecJ [Rhodobacteraceae bacterium]|nr:single-stranded-DNA-specific exonuclease RecJ [Paracoccaceae bacterium]
MSAYLGIETSLTGRRWLGPPPETERQAEALSQATTLPDVLSLILASRGVQPSEVDDFLSPSLRALMPDPSLLKDMDKAAARIFKALQGNEHIAIFADYDVDGATSAAQLLGWFKELGHSATLYIPDRLKEGYGPNEPAMKALAQEHSLIICVDCGTVAHAPIKVAVEAGADVIVLDHHLGGETLPPALAVVNPNRQDEESEYTYLCAAGVVFLTLVAVNRHYREAGIKAPPLMDMLDLVALGTVADVAPLTGFNRALVRQGLKVMAARNRPGLVALSDVAAMASAPKAYHLGYLLGPRINAGGRIGKADLGTRLLTTTDTSEAQALAERLDALNKERREIESAVQVAAEAQAETRSLEGPLVWAAGKGWHPGVVGIVASRLKEKYNRPAVVIGINDEGLGHGSGRSVSGIDLGVAIAALAREEKITKGGGHKMAAGLSVPEAGIKKAMAALAEKLAKQGAGEIGPRDLKITAALGTGAATPALIEQIEAAGPFGAGAPAPRFAILSARIRFAKPAGESHLRLTIDNGSGPLDVIAFRAFETPLGQALLNHAGQVFHFVGRLEIDEWGGRRKAKLQLEDAAKAE